MFAYVGLFTAYAFVPMFFFVFRPFRREYVSRRTYFYNFFVRINVSVLRNSRRIRRSYKVGTSTFKHFCFYFRVKNYNVLFVVSANKRKSCFAIIVRPSPFGCGVCMTKRAFAFFSIAMLTIIAIVKRIAVRFTSSRNYRFGICVFYFSKNFAIFFVAIYATILLVTFRRTSGFYSFYKFERVSVCSNCGHFSFTAYAIRRAFASLRTGRGFGYRFIFKAMFANFRLFATNAFKPMRVFVLNPARREIMTFRTLFYNFYVRINLSVARNRRRISRL